VKKADSWMVGGTRMNEGARRTSTHQGRRRRMSTTDSCEMGRREKVPGRPPGLLPSPSWCAPAGSSPQLYFELLAYMLIS
jgi:hypothetical protein